MPDTIVSALFALVLSSYYGFLVWREWRRRAGWRALVAKYELQDEQTSASARIAPDPRIPGAFRRAELSHYVQGAINGVPVAAFDILSGTFRFRPQSSGVGIQQVKLSLSPIRGFVASEVEGWTFLYRDRLFRPARPLKAARIEELWTTLLHAAGTAAIPPNAFGEEASEGIMIRPKKLI